MKKSYYLFSVIFITLLAISGTALIDLIHDASTLTGSAQERAQIGKQAPDFTLKSLYGKSFSLSDFKGKIVVLEWINQDCPIWRGRLDSLTKTYAELFAPKAGKGRPVKSDTTPLVWLCIDSTHYMTPERNRAFAAQNGIAKPVLMDPKGAVGTLYGARTTPHIFIVDAQGILVYKGAPDTKHAKKAGEAEKSLIKEVVTALLEGNKVTTATSNPYGCSVKYKR